jgi:ParB family chromosome partitioning protein
MGSIDCDPASNELAQQTVKVSVYFTPKIDGLKQTWKGNIFLNPPYSQPEITQFIDKLISEIQNGNQAILLTNDNTDTAWFHKAAKASSAVCFMRGRINFLKADGSKSSPTNGQAFFYFGNKPALFKKYFREFGLLMKVI